MPGLRHIVDLVRLLALCAVVLPLRCLADSPNTGAIASNVTPPARAATSTRHNPYDNRLAELQARLKTATPPEAAVLIGHIYELRDFLSDPEQIVELLESVAADTQQQALVRDEAVHYLARIDVHTQRLEAAEARLKGLGFIRQWASAGPFPAPQGVATKIPTPFDQDPQRHSPEWRLMPPPGPQEWIDLARFYPPSGPSVILVATRVYSEAARNVALRFGVESAVAVEVNGSPVFSDFNSDGGIGFDQHAVSVNLRAGWNTLVLKMARDGDGPWRFGLRITELDGRGVMLPVAADWQMNAAECGTAGSTCTPPAGPLPAPADLLDTAKAAADADPNSAAALQTLGYLERLHARGAAREHLLNAARRAPTAERWLAVAENCDGDTTCVFGALNTALGSSPDNEAVHVALANYYFGRNQLEKARDLLREAARLEPGDFVARNGLVDLYIAVGLNALAQKEAEQLQREFPEPLWLKRKLGARYLDLGLLDQAKDVLTAALELNYDGGQERSLLLRIAQRRHDLPALRAAYSQALELNPGDPVVLADMAELAAGNGDYAVAERTMRTAIGITSADGGLRERWSNLLARWGRPNEAKAELAQAAALEPQNEEVRTRYRIASATSEGTDPDANYLVEPAEVAADARRDPPAVTGNAVSLADVRVEQVYATGLSSVREQQIFYVATDQGARDYGTRAVQYSPATQDLHVLHARVFKSDGRVLPADETGENSVADANVSMYYDVRSRVVRFPAVERGDVIELDYRISPTTKVNPYGDYYGGLVVFRSNLAEKLQRYVLITPAERPFKVIAPGMEPAVTTTQGGQRIFEWEARDLAPLPNEARGPAITDVAPYVHVSTLSSWGDLGRWYSQLIQPQFALDASLREVAARLLKNCRTDQERISAIHQFVLRNTHYVALEFGIYSYKPYPVTQTYARRFGDCKDKASLMIALLRYAGIEADIALVRTRRLGDVDPQAISVALFNHAIVYLPKYDLWLDGTAEYAGSRELPLEDQGAMAVTVAASGATSLRRIPITQPNDNYTRRTVRAQLLADGRIQFTGVTYTRGENAPGLRREYETPERQRDAVRSSLAEIFSSVRVDDVHVQGANDFEHPVTVEFRGTLESFANRPTVPLTSSWLPRSYVQTLAGQTARTQDLMLPAPWTTEEELHFELPAGAIVTAMPADTVLETPFGSAALHYARAGAEVVVRTSVQFRAVRISPGDYDAFREFCQQAEQAFHNEVKVRLRG